MTTTHQPRPQVTTEIPAVPLTTEGYSVLHQMMRLRWPAWRALPASAQSAIANEAFITALARASSDAVGPPPANSPHMDDVMRAISAASSGAQPA